MKRLAIVAVMATLVAGVCSRVHAETQQENTVYYTSVGFFNLGGTHESVNYMKGTWVPVNTKVQLLTKEKSFIMIRILESGEEVKLSNAKKYSGVDIDAMFERMLSREPKDLSTFPPEHVKKILWGEFAPGMTKAEIIVAIGYPPVHATPSLDKDSWRYWRNKFNTVVLHFKDDVLDHIQE